MTIQELRRALRECRHEMKELGIRRISCFNGGLSRLEYQYNAKLFELKQRLEKSLRESTNTP